MSCLRVPHVGGRRPTTSINLPFPPASLSLPPSLPPSSSLPIRTLANFIFFMRRFSAFPNRASWSAVVPRKNPELIFALLAWLAASFYALCEMCPVLFCWSCLVLSCLGAVVGG